MSCEHVRERLLELPVAEFDQLAEHLSACADCREVADRIAAAEDTIGLAVDDFAALGSFEDAWERAVAEAPVVAAPVWGRRLRLGGLAAAAAAVLALGLTASRPSGPVQQGAQTIANAFRASPPAEVVAPAPPAVPEPPAELPSHAAAPSSRHRLPAPPASVEVQAILEEVSELVVVGEQPEGVAQAEAWVAREAAACGADVQERASFGKLLPDETTCLQTVLAQAERQTERDRVSRILMANAWAQGDEARWEGLVRHHFEAISQSDPDLCYKYAAFLSRGGVERTDELLHWSEIALERRATWTSDKHAPRVYGLFKLRAQAAERRWRALEERVAETGADEDRELADAARTQTLVLAREWLDFARAAGFDETLAYPLCISVAGTTEPCKE